VRTRFVLFGLLALLFIFAISSYTSYVDERPKTGNFYGEIRSCEFKAIGGGFGRKIRVKIFVGDVVFVRTFLRKRDKENRIRETLESICADNSLVTVHYIVRKTFVSTNVLKKIVLASGKTIVVP
jgi:hypothetical protein